MIFQFTYWPQDPSETIFIARNCMTEGNFTVKFIQKLKQKFNNLNIYKKLIKNLSETKIEASYKF